MANTKYELLIVSKLGQSDGLLERVEKSLKSANANEVKTNKMGKKVLAYQIKKQTEADYTLINFEAEGAAISDLTDLLRLEQESLLRYLILVEKKRKLRKKVTKREKKKVEVVEKKPKVTVVTKTDVAKGSEGTEESKGSKDTKAKKVVAKKAKK